MQAIIQTVANPLRRSIVTRIAKTGTPYSGDPSEQGREFKCAVTRLLTGNLVAQSTKKGNPSWSLTPDGKKAAKVIAILAPEATAADAS